MTFLRLLFFIFSMSLFVSCSDDLLPEKTTDSTDGENSELTLKIGLTLTSPSNTRGTTKPDGTSSEGTIPGFYNENLMDEFFLFFRAYNEATETYENKFHIHYTDRVDFNNIKNVSTDRIILPVKISPEDLIKIAGNDKVQVFIIGNMDESTLQRVEQYQAGAKNMINNFDPDVFFTKIANTWSWMSRFPGEGGYSVPLVNGHYCEVKGFKYLNKEELESLISNSGTSEKSLEQIQQQVQETLNTIFSEDVLDLERICARIDIADGSPNKDGIYSLNASDPECPFYVRLTRMSPININRWSYIFRHSAHGDENGIYYDDETGFDITLFGDERGENEDFYNWVADADLDFKYQWEDDGKDGGNSSNNSLDDHYYLCPQKNDSQTLLPWIDGTYSMMNPRFVVPEKAAFKDNFYDENNFNYLFPKNEREEIKYYPWRYIPENTLPTRLGTRMTLTSGIRFSFALWDKDNDKALTKDRAIEINNSLPENSIYKIVPTEDNTPTAIVSIGDESQCAIQHNGWEGYMFHYLYYFHHNYNTLDPDAITPMKYGVVRNNVYRVRVVGLNGVPRTYVPKDPVDPVDSYDILVETEMLPWGIRRDEGIILE